MKDEEVKAKAMFFDYACNTFFMSHDGVYEDYKRYDMTDAQEKEWRREYIALWVSRLEVDDLTPVDRLRDAWAGEALPALMEMAHPGDSYAKLWYANAIWQIANGVSIAATLQEQAREFSIGIWESFSHLPIELTDGHRLMIRCSLTAFNVSTPEEYVRNAAKQQLKLAQGQPSGNSAAWVWQM